MVLLNKLVGFFLALIATALAVPMDTPLEDADALIYEKKDAMPTRTLIEYPSAALPVDTFAMQKKAAMPATENGPYTLTPKPSADTPHDPFTKQKKTAMAAIETGPYVLTQQTAAASPVDTFTKQKKDAMPEPTATPDVNRRAPASDGTDDDCSSACVNDFESCAAVSDHRSFLHVKNGLSLFGFPPL
ncbi:MAG: hypothetical protein M1820_009586 [Bogoriella megaspora]|nr:MAG: hypothetical protein M1820_009586 [Bogoriella megaspora]